MQTLPAGKLKGRGLAALEGLLRTARSMSFAATGLIPRRPSAGAFPNGL